MINELKTFLRDTLKLPPDLIFMAAGLVSHIVLCLLLRKPITSGWGLLAPLILGILIESYEIWIHYYAIGLFAPGNDPLHVILLRHSTDMLKWIVLPLLLVTMMHVRRIMDWS